MVRHQPCTSTASSSDLAKIKFKPGKFKIIKTTKIFTTPKLALNDMSKTLTSSQNLSEPISTDKDAPNPNTLTENNQSHCRIASNQEGSMKAYLTKYNIPTNNSFEVLSKQVDQEAIEMETTEPETTNKNMRKTNTPQNTNNKPRRPPPLVIHSKVNQHKNFCEVVNKEIKKGYHIKYTQNNTNVFVYDQDEYDKYLEKITNDGIEFHTYSTKADKHHAFIIRGLDNSVESDDFMT